MASDRGLRELKLNEQPLFPEKVSATETDALQHRFDDGTVIEAKVVGSRIVGYTARDSAGKPIPVRRLRIADGRPPGPDVERENHCYYCICTPTSCDCWPEPCPVA